MGSFKPLLTSRDVSESFIPVGQLFKVSCLMAVGLACPQLCLFPLFGI